MTFLSLLAGGRRRRWSGCRRRPIWSLTGAAWKGVVLVLVGVLVIGLIDNLLRPVLVGSDTRLPDYVVLVSTIGGISLFGINGFVIGPLIAALFIVAWALFRDEQEGDRGGGSRRSTGRGGLHPPPPGLGRQAAGGVAMAFFQKLKERLFKSSSKLEEGLDAILDEAPAARAGRARRGAAAGAERPGSSAACSARSRAACSTTRCSRASRSC